MAVGDPDPHASDSATTGERGDITLIDDPHNVREAESEAVRRETILWHDEAFFNRIASLRIETRRTIYPLNRANEALADLREGRMVGTAVLAI